MDKLIQVLKSRTVITLIVILATNLVAEYSNLIAPIYLAGINVALTTLAAYFRINPKQDFNQ